MAKTKISEYSQTASNNTDLNGISCAEGMAPSDVNNWMRELMSQVKDFQVGAEGDPLTVAGTFVAQGRADIGGNLNVTGATALTGTLTAAAGIVANITGNVTGNVTGNASTATTATTVSDGAITTAKIADANVTLAKLEPVGTTGQILTSNGTGSAPSYQARVFSATAQASTSGTSIDFTSIPSWVKRVTVMFSQVSTNGSSNYLIQIGDSGGIEITGYSCVSQRATGTTVAMVGYTQGLGISTSGAGESISGGVTLLAVGTSNTWVMSGNFSEGSSRMYAIAGTKSLSDTLDRVRITTVNGTDTFDAGSINILYE
jgi:hypothetical protein